MNLYPIILKSHNIIGAAVKIVLAVNTMMVLLIELHLTAVLKKTALYVMKVKCLEIGQRLQALH